MTSEILKCVICDMIHYEAHNPNISRPISLKLLVLEENQISLGTDRVIVQKIICREGPDGISRSLSITLQFSPGGDVMTVL